METNNLTKEAAPGFGKKTIGRVAPVKPVKSIVTKTAFEKTAAEKVAITMTPAEVTALQNAGRAVAPAAASFGQRVMNLAIPTVVAMGVVSGAQGLSGFVTNQMDKMKAKKAFEAALQLNPKLQTHPRNVLESYFQLVMQSSPAVATNPLLLANYLDYMIGHEGALNFAAFKQLAELEGTIADTAKAKRPLGDMATKSIIDSAVKHM